MGKQIDHRQLAKFAELRARGKTVADASKRMGITERTGWRWNAVLKLRDENPDAQANRAESKPRTRRAGGRPGDRPQWVEEVEVAEANGEIEEPQDIGGELPLPGISTEEARAIAGLPPRPDVNEQGRLRFTSWMVQGEIGVMRRAGSHAGRFDAPNAHEARRTYAPAERGGSAVHIHSISGNPIPPQKGPMRGYWLNWRD
jgi:hypothetical protein